MKIMKFKLSGLHCASCQGLIEDVSREVPGVRNATVDLKTETLTIEHGDEFRPDSLTESVIGLGAGYAVQKL